MTDPVASFEEFALAALPAYGLDQGLSLIHI